MEKEYYILALNNNESKNPMKIDNIIYKGEEYSLPQIIIDAIKESVFEGVEVLAVKTLLSFRDVITGEIITNSSTGIENGVSYYKAVKAKREDIIRITKLYESMSNEDVQRYKNAMNKIKEKSIRIYLEKLAEENRILNEEKNARDYLVSLQNWSS